MLVQEVMTTRLTAITAEMSITRAAEAMKARDVGLLPVVSERRRVLGVVSDRDIVFRGVAEGLSADTTPVSEVATRPAIWCHCGDSVEKAGGLMAAMEIRRLLVMDDSGQPAGIVTLGDLAVKVPEKAIAGETLAGIRGVGRAGRQHKRPVKAPARAPADPRGRTERGASSRPRRQAVAGRRRGAVEKGQEQC